MVIQAPELYYLLGALALVLVAGTVVMVQRSQRIAALQAEQGVLSERLNARDAEIARTADSISLLQEQLASASLELNVLREKLAREQTVREQEALQHTEKVQLLQEARDSLTLQFRQLANEILEQKGKSFAESSQQKIQELLKPLGEKIQGFEKRVEETYDKESRQRFALEKEIRTLLELNNRISVDAVNLTNALRGESKTQGIWGEVILERVLEKSGLEKGREYEVQVSLRDESGNKGQPDVVVHLPEGKDVIIDSKVSLTAYQGYFAAEDDASRAQHLKLHLQSIRNHIRQLSEKSYQHLEGVSTLDYVLMFLPVEAAFTLAVQQDDLLFTDAFAKNIILVGPSTLLATLRTIQSIWRYEYQNKNALEIARQAGQLYDKFVGFVDDIDEVGRRIEQAHTVWDQAHNKLSSGKGNLVTRIEKLKTLGARARKQLPQQLLEDGSDTDDLDGEDGLSKVSDDD